MISLNMALKVYQWGRNWRSHCPTCQWFQTIALTMGTTSNAQNYMVEQIVIGGMECDFTARGRSCSAFYSQLAATIMQDLLRGVITSGATTTFRSADCKSAQRAECWLDWKNRYPLTQMRIYGSCCIPLMFL